MDYKNILKKYHRLGDVSSDEYDNKIRGNDSSDYDPHDPDCRNI
jgi:hypothetical protein